MRIKNKIIKEKIKWLTWNKMNKNKLKEKAMKNQFLIN